MFVGLLYVRISISHVFAGLGSGLWQLCLCQHHGLAASNSGLAFTVSFSDHFPSKGFVAAYASKVYFHAGKSFGTHSVSSILSPAMPRGQTSEASLSEWHCVVGFLVEGRGGGGRVRGEGAETYTSI